MTHSDPCNVRNVTKYNGESDVWKVEQCLLARTTVIPVFIVYLGVMVVAQTDATIVRFAVTWN